MTPAAKRPRGGQLRGEERADDCVRVKLTAAEKALLKERAENAQQTLSEYVRCVALGGK